MASHPHFPCSPAESLGWLQSTSVKREARPQLPAVVRIPWEERNKRKHRSVSVHAVWQRWLWEEWEWGKLRTPVLTTLSSVSLGEIYTRHLTTLRKPALQKARGLRRRTKLSAECGWEPPRPSLGGAWGGSDSSGAVFSLLQRQGPSFTKGVRPLGGRVNHLGKVPPSGLGRPSVTSFLFTPPERRSECCWSTFNRLETQLQTNFQSPPYPLLLSLVRGDKMPTSREDLETLSPGPAE